MGMSPVSSPDGRTSCDKLKVILFSICTVQECSHRTPEVLGMWLECITNWILIVFSFARLKFKYPYGTEWLLWGTAQFSNSLSWCPLLQTGPNWFGCKFTRTRALFVMLTAHSWEVLSDCLRNHVCAPCSHESLKDERVRTASAEALLRWLQTQWRFLHQWGHFSTLTLQHKNCVCFLNNIFKWRKIFLYYSWL